MKKTIVILWVAVLVLYANHLVEIKKRAVLRVIIANQSRTIAAQDQAVRDSSTLLAKSAKEITAMRGDAEAERLKWEATGYGVGIGVWLYAQKGGDFKRLNALLKKEFPDVPFDISEDDLPAHQSWP